MSYFTDDGKRLVLENVIVSYNPKDGSLSLTSKDPDLAGKPFKVTLGEQSASERSLRELLAVKGLIDEERVNEFIPTYAPYVFDKDSDSGFVKLGVGAAGDVGWDVEEFPNMWLTGGTGSGKSVLARSVINHCITHKDEWMVYGVDLKRVELSVYKEISDVVCGVATTLDEAYDLLKNLHALMVERLKLMESENISSYKELLVPQKAVMLIFDEASMVLASEAVDSSVNDSVAHYQNLRRWSSRFLAELLRLGRIAGIHIVVGAQRPDASVVSAEMQANLHTRVVAGRVSSVFSRMVLGSSVANRTAKVKGRIVVRSGGQSQQAQLFYSSLDEIRDWVSENDSDS